MKSKFLSTTAAVAVFCLFSVSLSACNVPGRTARQQNQYNVTGQNRNLTDGNVQNGNPNVGPGGVSYNAGTDPRLNNNIATDPRLDNRTTNDQRLGSTPRNNLNGNMDSRVNPGATQLNQYRTQPPQAFDTQKAINIENSLNNMAGVRNARVVVNGNTAIVSYTPVNTATNVNATKSAIVNRVKQVDRSITNCAVSDSPDIGTRVNQLSRDINNTNNTRPGQELTDSFNKLMNNINNAVR